MARHRKRPPVVDDAFPTSAPTRIDLGAGSQTIADLHPIVPLPRLGEGELIAGRFRITGMLGRGGFGEVYRVIDARDVGRSLALKLHRVAGKNRLALEALKGEFALLASLRHPNLAPVHDFGYVGDDVAFFTQSIVPGVPLDRADVALTSREGLGLLAQLCRALDYLHARGILHRDVKPSNVLVDVAGGRVTLLDFGISRAFGQTDALDLAGTHAFMAPEAIQGAQLDARSDFYSLGVTLYVLLAGRPPFTGSAEEVLRGHVFEPAPPLEAHGVPEGIARVVHRLLAKQPGDRHATGAEVIDALSRAVGIDVAGESVATLTSYVLSGRFVGNEPILDRLSARVASAGSAERPPPIVLVGEAGTGKSRLVRELSHRAQLDGASVVAARARRGDDAKDLLGEVARAVLTEDVVRGLGDDDRIELSRSVPALRKRGERIAMPLDPERARLERLRALGTATAMRFAYRPGVLVVEDAHFATEDVGAALHAFFDSARRADASMLLVVTTRPGPLADGLARALAAERIDVPELDPRASAALVASMFGDAGIIADTELGRALATRSHPALVVQESLRLAVESGAIVRVRGSWALVAPLRARPESEILAARIEHLGPRAKELGLACAALAHPAATDEIAKVAGWTLERAASGLAELVGAGIVDDLRDGRGRPVYAMHDRFVDAVLAQAKRERLSAAHERAAKMLTSRGAGDPYLLSRAAEHLALAGRTAEAHAVFERAAREADRAGRPDSALALLERAEQVAPERARAVDGRLLHHDLAVKAGAAEKARNVLDTLEKRRGRLSAADRVRVDVRRARAALRSGSPAVTRIARRAVAAARALSEPSLELEALLASGDIELALGHIEPALERFLEARTLAKKRRDRAGLARASLGAALAAIHLGQLPVAEGHALEAARHAEKRADPEMLSDALRHLGNVARERGDLSRAAVSYRRAVKAAREHGSVDREAKALNNLGTVVQWAGRIDEALLAFERAIALKERSGAESSALLTHNNLGALFLAIGRFSEAERELGRCLAAGASPMLIEVARSNLGDLRALRGDLDGAIEAYRASLVFCRKEGVPTQESHVLVGLVRTLIMRRDDPLGEMAALLGELAALLPVGVAQLPRRYHTTRAMWLDVSGDTAGALLEAERAIRATDRKVLFSDVFGTYLEARWIRALLLARLGRRRAAARALEECRSLLGRLALKLGSPAAARRFVEDHPLHRAIHRGDLSLPPGLTFRVDDAPSD